MNEQRLTLYTEMVCKNQTLNISDCSIHLFFLFYHHQLITIIGYCIQSAQTILFFIWNLSNMSDKRHLQEIGFFSSAPPSPPHQRQWAISSVSIHKNNEFSARLNKKEKKKKGTEPKIKTNLFERALNQITLLKQS